MTASAVPFIFVPNTTELSSQVNANFAAVVSDLNAIDAGQITTGTIAAARLNLTTANLTDITGPTTFTPNDGSGAALAITNNGSAFYRIGKLFVCQIDVTYPVTASGATASIGNLPFTFNNVGVANFGGAVIHSDGSGSAVNWSGLNNQTKVQFFAVNGSGLFSNANLSTLRLAFTVIGFTA